MKAWYIETLPGGSFQTRVSDTSGWNEATVQGPCTVFINNKTHFVPTGTERTFSVKPEWAAPKTLADYLEALEAPEPKAPTEPKAKTTPKTPAAPTTAWNPSVRRVGQCSNCGKDAPALLWARCRACAAEMLVQDTLLLPLDQIRSRANEWRGRFCK